MSMGTTWTPERHVGIHDEHGRSTGARGPGDAIRDGVAPKLRGQHRSVVHAEAKEHEVEAVVELGVGHAEVAHEAHGAVDGEAHNHASSHCERILLVVWGGHAAPGQLQCSGGSKTSFEGDA